MAKKTSTPTGTPKNNPGGNVRREVKGSVPTMINPPKPPQPKK